MFFGTEGDVDGEQKGDFVSAIVAISVATGHEPEHIETHWGLNQFKEYYAALAHEKDKATANHAYAVRAGVNANKEQFKSFVTALTATQHDGKSKAKTLTNEQRERINSTDDIARVDEESKLDDGWERF